MMNRNSYSVSKRHVIWAAFLLASALVLAQPGKAQAQQWVTNGNNINNTNSGNVGIGTPSPAYNLQVVGQIFASGPNAFSGFQDRTTAGT